MSLHVKVAVASGFFNPLHVGHLAYLQAARDLADLLIVIVNNDWQVTLKGSVPFLLQDDRLALVRALRCVDHAFLSIDCDRTVCQTLENLARQWPIVAFANGGDVTEDAVLELEVCNRLGIQVVCGVGGRHKVRSSSSLLAAVTGV